MPSFFAKNEIGIPESSIASLRALVSVMSSPRFREFDSRIYVSTGVNLCQLFLIKMLKYFHTSVILLLKGVA